MDILYRDLDAVESWTREAAEGRFEVLSQNGYLVGAPTYLPVGELAISQPITGALPRPRFPEPPGCDRKTTVGGTSRRLADVRGQPRRRR